MLIELATATAMVTVTVLIHGAGLYLLTRILRLEAEEEAAERASAISPRGIAGTVAVILGLFALHDAAMAERWRRVSAIEGINGIILIGWSTAFFVTLVARLRRI